MELMKNKDRGRKLYKTFLKIFTEKMEKAKNDTNLKILEMAANLEEEKKNKLHLTEKLDEANKSLENEKSKLNKDVSNVKFYRKV